MTMFGRCRLGACLGVLLWWAVPAAAQEPVAENPAPASEVSLTADPAPADPVADPVPVDGATDATEVVPGEEMPPELAPAESAILASDAPPEEPGMEASPDIYRDFGDYYMRHGSLDEAEASFRKALERAPGAVSLYIKLGEVLRLQGRTEEAVGYLQKGVELDPDGAEARNNLGVALIELGELEVAEALYADLLEDHPGYALGYVNLGVAQLKSGKSDLAVAQYNKAIAIDPENTHTYYNIGNAYLDLGRPQEALSWFDRALERDPDQAVIHNNQGVALRALGRLGDAVEAYGRAIALDAEDPDFYFNLGVAEAEMGEVEASIIAYRNVLELNDRYPGVHHNQGTNYYRLNVPSQAEGFFGRASELAPNDPVPVNNLCVVLLAQKRHDDALSVCDQAVELDPEYRDAAYNRIQVLLAVGRYEKAVGEGQQLLGRLEAGGNSERAQVLTALSAAHFGLEQWAAAAEAADEALQADPNLARAHYNRGRVYQQQAHNLLAMESFKMATQLDNRDAEAFMRLGEVYDRLGQPEAAEAAYRRGGRLNLE